LTSLKNLPENVFAVKSNAAVVDYVSSHPEALGLIDVSWISDRDDATTNTFLGSVKVVGLSTGGEYYKPFQAYLSQRQYPLLRDVYLISREGRTGLATGFTAFVASDKGQRVILKSGLVPATMPVRIVEINRTPFK
jgi:phosphate transport system substrate-binding protein